MIDAHISSYGDPSVGIQGVYMVCTNVWPESMAKGEREINRRLLADFFTEFTQERCTVRFSDELDCDD